MYLACARVFLTARIGFNAMNARINHPANTIGMQPRYLLTSLALNDFAIGILITPLGILPALFHCWPYGEIFCQIQVIDFVKYCIILIVCIIAYCNRGQLNIPDFIF